MKMTPVRIAFGLLILFATSTWAATPSSGTLSPTNRVVVYSTGPQFVSNVSPVPVLQTSYQCGVANPCDDFTLTVSLPADYATTNPRDRISFRAQWPTTANDFDMYILNAAGTEVTRSAGSTDPEQTSLPAGGGSYTLKVRIVPFTVTGDSATITISLGVPDASVVQADPGIAPRFQVYPAPDGMGADAGEPSIGVNGKSGNVMFQAGLETLRVSFNDATSPARASWLSTESVVTGTASMDPISWTDRKTGRTIVSQLIASAGATGLAIGEGCTLAAYTNDDGASWVPSKGCGTPGGNDHQTVGGGRYHAINGVEVVNPVYENAVYFAAQVGVSAYCARSDDGGQTFGAGVPMYNLTQCGGIHGHVQVSPADGTVYVPNGQCGVNQALAVSEDNGATWSVRPIPTSTTNSNGINDPSVGIGAKGALYFAYRAVDGHAHVAISDDHGQSWHDDLDVGSLAGVENSVFHTAVAGDDDRAAIAFLGSAVPGDYQAPDYQGEWYLYIATTFDHGKHWSVVNATPNDPVQRGCIWLQGGSNDCRNLLDFMGITIDAVGRVLVGFADGCTGACVNAWPNTGGALATIARQSGGRRLLAQFDPAEPTVPATPSITGVRTNAGVELSWPLPDNGGSTITGYRIYRGASNSEQPISSGIDTSKNEYVDTTITGGASTPYYKVSAVNAVGEGGLSNEILPPVAPIVFNADPCVAPGVTVANDPAGDETGASELDLRSISISEPQFPDAAGHLVFTLKVSDLAVVPPNASWKVYFTAPNKTQYFVEMNTFDPTAIKFSRGHVQFDPTTNTNSNVSDGSLDAGSGYTADGNIVLIVATANVGGPTAGQTLTSVKAETQALVGATKGLLLTTDSTATGSYTVFGNSNCHPNNPPIAQLVAAPSQGVAPLTVDFDASSSYDVDSGDKVVGFAFDFGDGTTQNSSLWSARHIYNNVGTYNATVSVTDSRGKTSATPASVTIMATSAPTAPGHLTGGGFLAGGLTRFSFDVRSDKTGWVSYSEEEGVAFSATSGIDSWSTSGACASFGGTAKTDDGRSIRYRIDACDLATPGKNGDTFAITITGDATSARSGPVAGGNIKLQSK